MKTVLANELWDYIKAGIYLTGVLAGGKLVYSTIA